MPIVSVYTIKGGVGKTTILEVLAIGLATLNKKVLVVDADLQADLSYRLLGDTLSTFSVFSKTNYGIGAITLSDASPIPQKIIDNLYIIPMEPDTIVKADERIITNFEFLKDEEFTSKYDFILIDTPPSYDFVVAENIMKVSDHIFTVVTPSVPVIRTVNMELMRTLPTIMSALKHPAYFLGIIKNMIHTSKYVTTEQINIMMENLEKACQQSKINKYTPCFFNVTIPQRGSIFEYDKLRELLISPQQRKKLYSFKSQILLRKLVEEFMQRINYFSEHR